MKNFFVRHLWLGALLLVIAGCGGSSGSGSLLNGSDDHHDHDHDHPEPTDDVSADVVTTPLAGNACVEGMAGIYPCLNMDMLGGLKFSVQGSDIWGWEDTVNGDEYAILGLSTGTTFIRVTQPDQPEFVGFLPTATTSSGWRDVKVIHDHALVVSEAANHGVQIIDLSVLATLTELTLLTADTHYTDLGSAHNIAVNEESGFAYAVGSNTCSGGLHMIDVSDPQAPAFAGCYAEDGYTHDVQCVNYAGPDQDYLGQELCFAANEDTLTIVDVTDKEAPTLVARESYVGASYAHQGWLSEDQRYFFLGDETDELGLGHNTRTYIWNLTDLDAPVQSHTYTATTSAIDHNLYVLEDHVYQANYEAGVRILRTGNLAAGEVAEVAFFDTVPGSDRPEFNGVWSVYPYLSSGTILTANDSGEFFALRAQLQAIPRCSDGLDNDSDGAVDYPEDEGCSSAVAEFEE
jgi:choice-of-anchor B domain-containing protein